MALAVLIVDDHQALAEALAGRLRLESDFSTVMTALSFGAAMAAVARDPFDVVVTDIELGQDDGVELIRRIHEQYPGIATVALTMHDEVPTAFQALRAGALGFVAKDDDTKTLIEAIRCSVRGETHISPSLLTGVLEGFRSPGSLRTDLEDRVERLTPRERQVLILLVAGVDRPKIAAELFLSLNTVRTHIKNILAKLEVHSTLEAVALALRVGLRASADVEGDPRADEPGTRGRSAHLENATAPSPVLGASRLS